MKSLTRALLTTGLLVLAGCNDNDGCVVSVLSGTESYTNPTPQIQEDTLGFENNYNKSQGEK